VEVGSPGSASPDGLCAYDGVPGIIASTNAVIIVARFNIVLSFSRSPKPRARSL
jgi:hypothetical protein